jgi:hypothetical protein
MQAFRNIVGGLLQPAPEGDDDAPRQDGHEGGSPPAVVNGGDVTEGDAEATTTKRARPGGKRTGGKEDTPPIICQGCGESLERDHTGISCGSDHHICTANGCALNFVNHVLSEGPSAIPVKCMECHVDVIPSTFERNVPVESQAAYMEVCVLVGGRPEPGSRWHRCPLCPNMIILIESEGEMVFNCTNCDEPSCMVCSAKVNSDREYQHHLLDCGAHGALRNEILDVINDASQAKCPACGHHGQKDDACCHMTCPACHMKWCYVCGLSRAEADGGEYGHNTSWESNPARCPMYLDFVHRENPEWPEDGEESVAHFHARKIRHALRQKVEATGRDRVEAMLEHFPATLAPYTLPEVMAATEPRDF